MRQWVTWTVAALAISVGASGAIAEDAVRFDPDGTGHIQDLTVPIPPSLSPEAAAWLKARTLAPDPSKGFSVPAAQIRPAVDARNAQTAAAMLKLWPAKIETKELGGVTVRLVTPERLAPGGDSKLLINFHGGAFMLGTGSVIEAIPIAGLSGIPVLAVDYRLAPEHPFPAAVDDAIAVYRELLKQYRPQQLAFYGSSAGAVLSAQASVRARQLGLPLPAAIGFFSGTADMARPADTEALFSLSGLAPIVVPVATQAKDYLGEADRRDPVMSPIYADLKGFPPTLCMSGTRDFFLSSTGNFHRALLRAGVDARLVVFDAMPHVHWNGYAFPEAQEALHMQAAFLASHVSD